MASLVVIFVVVAVLMSAGAVIGAEIQDRIAQGRRRRVTEQRRQLNLAIQMIRARGYAGLVYIGGATGESWGRSREVPGPASASDPRGHPKGGVSVDGG
jgi:type II secretory pathway pseudopilin PulG